MRKDFEDTVITYKKEHPAGTFEVRAVSHLCVVIFVLGMEKIVVTR
jgi:hypothetical protein